MKKKLLYFAMIVFIFIFTYFNYNTSYCEELTNPKNKILNELAYDQISNISSEINLTAKNIITESDKNFEKNKDKYIKDINYIITNINYLIVDLQGKAAEYKEDKYLLNGLYGAILILDEYRFSLTRLEEFIYSKVEENAEDQFSNLQAFYALKDGSDNKLNASKLKLSQE